MSDDEERPVFNAVTARAMEVSPGNRHHDEGEQVVIMTIAKGIEIEPLVFPIDDAKLVVTKMLVALATYEDSFAQKLLDDHFPPDADDEFTWPREPYQSF